MLSLWATFVSQVHLDPDLEREHREGYLAFRRATETLIAEVLSAEGREPTPEACRRLAIAVNALIDGLWIEGCLSADEIDDTMQIGIGLSSIGALLGIELPAVPPLPRH